MNFLETAETNLKNRLKDNPHRGVILGRLITGKIIGISYVMGRSPNSQNRIYVLDKKQGILRTEAANESKVEDSSLIIYNAMRVLIVKNRFGIIISNGAQTDTLFEAMNKQIWYNSHSNTEISLLRTYCEPDASIFTPRISVVFIDEDNPGNEVGYFSIIRPDEISKFAWNEVLTNNKFTWQQFDEKDRRNGTRLLNEEIYKLTSLNNMQFPSNRDFYKRPLDRGFGFLLTTYMPGFDELPAVRGDPLLIPLQHKTLEDAMQYIWKNLELEEHVDCRVSLGGIELISGAQEYRFAEPINKYEKVSH